MVSKQRIKQMVVDAYHEDPNLVNDDSLLIAYIWSRCGWMQTTDDMPLAERIKYMPRPESITRRRREAHEEGLITYSKKASEDRMEAFKNERDEHSAFYVGLETK